MKTTIILLIVLAAFMYWTNPDLNDFSEFVEEYTETKIEEEVGSSLLGKALSDAAGSISGITAGKMTKRDDYYLFSIYTVNASATIDSDNEPMKIVGLVKTFVPLDEPKNWDFVGDSKANSVFD